MKYLKILLLLCYLNIVGCSTYSPPNIDGCVKDAPEHEHCAYMMNGPDFEIDNVGHNYTLHGENENYDQFDKEAVRLSVGAYVMLRSSFLEWCHKTPKECTYQTVSDKLTEFEFKTGLDVRIKSYINQLQ